MLEKGDIVTFATDTSKHPPLKVVQVNLSSRAALVESLNTGRRFALHFARMLLLERAK